MCNNTAGRLSYTAKRVRRKDNAEHVERIAADIDVAAADAAEAGHYSMKKEFPVTSNDVQALVARLNDELTNREANYSGVEVSAIEDQQAKGDHIIMVSVSWQDAPEFI